jgi:hypothetical protein
MEGKKSTLRKSQMESDSAGDRRTGSVGERPDLVGSKDSGDRRSETHDSVTGAPASQETDDTL